MEPRSLTVQNWDRLKRSDDARDVVLSNLRVRTRCFRENEAELLIAIIEYSQCYRAFSRITKLETLIRPPFERIQSSSQINPKLKLPYQEFVHTNRFAARHD